MSLIPTHADYYCNPSMSARQVYEAVHTYLRLVYGQYDAFDCQALDRVQTFNYFCVVSGQQFEAVDAAFRSWEAVGIHRPTTKARYGFESRKQLHYRQLIINS